MRGLTWEEGLVLGFIVLETAWSLPDWGRSSLEDEGASVGGVVLGDGPAYSLVCLKQSLHYSRNKYILYKAECDDGVLEFWGFEGLRG